MQTDAKSIKEHQRASKSIKEHQRASKSIKEHQRASKSIKEHQGASRSIKEHQRAMFQLFHNEASSPCFAPLASMISARSFPLPLPFGAAGGPCHCF